MAGSATRTRTRRGARGRAHPLDALLATKEMILIAGSGGVGKTTMAAALAVEAATQQNGRVLVLTVDPARRLATALGIGSFGNEAVRVPDEAFAESGIKPQGELWAAMLDTKAGWDDLIRRHAPDDEIREAVLDNPLYQNITSRFVHSHDYLAMEQLHDLHATGQYDLVIVDTPPSRNALDILDAPSRMVEFFGSRLLKWLTVPYRSRIFSAASKPFYQIADRILGSHFLRDIADFFMLFQAMEKGFVKRAKQVEALLADPRTAFVVVSTLEAAPAHEAAYLANELTRRGLPLGAIIANRVLPEALSEDAARHSAVKLGELVGDAGFIKPVAKVLDTEPDVARDVLTEISARFHDVALVATREAERSAELAALAPMLLTAPMLDRDVTDVGGLLVLARALRGELDQNDS
jgi:anion-transporting  ArsA/GET3 family ATPase